MKKTKPLLFVIILLAACNSDEKKLQGGWLVDNAYNNKEHLVWNLLTNSIELRNDHTCLLPIPYENLKLRTMIKANGPFIKKMKFFT